MAITTADIKQLRESTGAGILDCKKALQETDGDVDKAIEVLRKKGLAAASKKASREANDGAISAEVTNGGKTGVMVEVNCETDFVARTDDFQDFVAALVRQVQENPALDNPEALLAAPFVDDSSRTVSDVLTETIAKLGENMVIKRVARFDLDGEGLIDSYVHMGGRVGVLVELVGASNDQASELAHDLALQIAAANPAYVNESDVPAASIAAEKDVYLAQLANDNKPDNIKERIIEGKLKKWYSEVVLLNQEFVKDGDLTIAKLVDKTSKEVGSPLTISRFARFELGEG
ncbi:MAG: translation elongation factor Ts [Anaerolineae bacterium]|nr:translation elongation factor Ts [Anaerolineae bacterium]